MLHGEGMLRASVIFFALGLIALVLGTTRMGGISFELGRLLLFVFLGLAILAFVAALRSSRKIIPASSAGAGAGLGGPLRPPKP